MSSYLSCAAADCVDSRPTAPSAWARLNVADDASPIDERLISRETETDPAPYQLICLHNYAMGISHNLFLYEVSMSLYTDATAAAHDLQCSVGSTLSLSVCLCLLFTRRLSKSQMLGALLYL